jgi:hypothetical protein
MLPPSINSRFIKTDVLSLWQETGIQDELIKHTLLKGYIEKTAELSQTLLRVRNQVFELGKQVLPRIFLLILSMQTNGMTPSERNIQTSIKLEEQFRPARDGTQAWQCSFFVLAFVRDIYGARVTKGMDDSRIGKPFQ